MKKRIEVERSAKELEEDYVSQGKPNFYIPKIKPKYLLYPLALILFAAKFGLKLIIQHNKFEGFTKSSQPDDDDK